MVLHRHLADLALQLGDALPFAGTDLQPWPACPLGEKLLLPVRAIPLACLLVSSGSCASRCSYAVAMNVWGTLMATAMR